MTTYIASVDNNGALRWAQSIDNVQVQLSYTIDGAGKSYIQIGGGFGGTFQGISTATNRYLELDSNGVLVRNMFQSPYKGLFRVKDDAIYGFTTEQGGFAATLTYGSYSFALPTDNTQALGILIKYDKTNDQVLWANTFTIVGDVFNSGKLLTIEPHDNGKILVGGMYKTSVIFGSNTFGTTTLSGGSPRDLFIADAISPTLASENFNSYKMTMYPNPANDEIHFSNADIRKVIVYSPFGQKVIERSLEADQNLDVSKLPSGTYLIEAADANGNQFHEKLLKN